jgi:hypothetical protein
MGPLLMGELKNMWMEKLADGILELDTPIGPRYVRPNFLQRAYLIWTFRNFFSLPQQVLRPRELRLIERLCSEDKFVSLSFARPGMAQAERPVIGRVERRTLMNPETLSARKPMQREPITSNRAVGEGSEAVSA